MSLAQAGDAPGAIQCRGRNAPGVVRHLLALLLLSAVCVPALIVRLSTCPPPWYDEGLRTHFARTLVEHGVYGTSTVGG